MLAINISKELKNVCPKLKLGCIQAKVRLKEKDESLSKELEQLCDQINGQLVLEQVASLPEITAARETYKRLGKTPSRYRVSSEALLRRVLQGKGLYQINNVVDINNFVSLKSHHSVGTYDIDKLQPPISFNVGGPGESYKGIGKELINIENLPVFADTIGNFGSPTSDSERAMITSEATNILMVIISFCGEKDLDKNLALAQEMLAKYALGTKIETRIVE